MGRGRKDKERPMEKMPSRDTSGKCEGECQNRVLEGQKSRQAEIEHLTPKR